MAENRDIVDQLRLAELEIRILNSRLKSLKSRMKRISGIHGTCGTEGFGHQGHPSKRVPEKQFEDIKRVTQTSPAHPVFCPSSTSLMLQVPRLGRRSKVVNSGARAVPSRAEGFWRTQQQPRRVPRSTIEAQDIPESLPMPEMAAVRNRANESIERTSTCASAATTQSFVEA